MKLLVRYNKLHPVNMIQSYGKEQEWKINIDGNYLYKLNNYYDGDIEVYFRVNFDYNAKDENNKSKIEKIPFEVYISKLPGFSDIMKSDFRPSGIPIVEKYFDLSVLFKNITFIGVKNGERNIKQYIVKSIIKSEIDSTFECEAYISFFTVKDFRIGKMKVKTTKLIKEIKKFLG